MKCHCIYKYIFSFVTIYFIEIVHAKGVFNIRVIIDQLIFNWWRQQTSDKPDLLSSIFSVNNYRQKKLKVLLVAYNTKTRFTKILGNFVCFICGKRYKVSRSLWRHQKYECQQEPRFSCMYCEYRAKQKASIVKHTMAMHNMVMID